MKELKWEARERLMEIERNALFLEHVNRKCLRSKFGISLPQATADISLYRSMSDNLAFNPSTKSYHPSDHFSPLFIECTIEELKELKNSISIESLPQVERNYSSDVLRSVSTAIFKKKSLLITYQSLSTPNPTQRRITPHAIIFNGYRHHIRAYCEKRDGFRDFVIGRILSSSKLAAPGLLSQDDNEWNTKILVSFKPHPSLTGTQRQIIEHDYNMRNGVLTLRIRECMKFYLLKLFNIDNLMQYRSPAEQQLILVEEL